MTADGRVTSQDNTPARYVEDSSVAFAMFCDTAGLSLDEGIALAERVGDALADVADSRGDYLPAALGGAA